MTFRLRIDPSTQGDCQRRPVQVLIDDGVLQLPIGFSRDTVCINGQNAASAAYDTTTWHTYEVKVHGAEVDFSADGSLLMMFWEFSTNTAWPSLTFGDGDSNAGTATRSYWDFLTFDTTTGCTIIGTAGNDTISGTSGNDVICGLGGNDVIDGKQGNDRIRGGDGADSLRGSSGDDYLDGGNGNDILIGGGGNDSLIGGPGDDSFRAESVADGSDLVKGGLGFDTANYSARTVPVHITLNYDWDDGSATANGGFEHDNVQVDVERAIGGSANDTMSGDQPQQTTLFGGAGDDVLDVRDYDGQPTDRIDGGAGNDTCLADPGVTLVSCP
jgi:Ca2+-binding RTX toxin-like protein